MRWIRETLSVLCLGAALLALAVGLFGCTSASLGIEPEPFPPGYRSAEVQERHEAALAAGLVEVKLPPALAAEMKSRCQFGALMSGRRPEDGLLVGVYRIPGEPNIQLICHMRERHRA